MRWVHGLTGDEVIALADQFAAEMQRVHDLTADEVVALAHTLFEEAKTKRAASAACQQAAQAQVASFPCIEIRSLQAETGSSLNLGGPYAKVVGEMKNLGDRSLDEVELTVTLLDGSGKPLGEDQRRPVGLLSLDNDGAVAPLRPNGARKFSTIIKAPPSKWAGKVEARITAVKFTERK
jgi:hypothetical protein